MSTLVLGSIYTQQQFSGDRQQKAKIWGKSVLVHVSDDCVVWIIKYTIWEKRRCVTDTWEIFSRLNICSLSLWSVFWMEIIFLYLAHVICKWDELSGIPQEWAVWQKYHITVFFFFF